MSQIRKKHNYKYNTHYYNQTAQDKTLQNQIETGRMSNNITKTEMVVDMKPAYKEDNAPEGRILRSRRGFI